VHLVDDAPDVVLTGGAGPEFGYQALNCVFGHLQRGAELMAMHANLFWRTSDGLSLDTGAFLLGLQQAAGIEGADPRQTGSGVLRHGAARTRCERREQPR